ncbi:MAG: hypothetical protein U0V72_07870 [Cytophagales bacterium]
MAKFGNIYLSWRKGSGHSRHIVGVIKTSAKNGVTFNYLSSKELEKAKADGFLYYTEFPELDKTYNTSVLEIFGQRLFRSERSDYLEFLSFWGIESIHKDDIAYLLAHTQGIVPTDNFEFLADFMVTKDLKIVSEIASLTYTKVPSSAINIKTELKWKTNPSIHDKFQVDLYAPNGLLIGHVKKIHSKVFFNKRSNNIRVYVKSIEKNGILKRVFIEIINKV